METKEHDNQKLKELEESVAKKLLFLYANHGSETEQFKSALLSVLEGETGFGLNIVINLLELVFDEGYNSAFLR